MRNFKEKIGDAKVSELVALLKERELPLIHENATIEQAVNAMGRFEHTRLLYVVDDVGKLVGTISLGMLVRHVFSPSREPKIHPRLIIGMITDETAKDLMQKNLVVTTGEEEILIVLKRMIRANVKEIPVLDKEKRVVADLTIIDLLKFIANFTGNG